MGAGPIVRPFYNHGAVVPPPPDPAPTLRFTGSKVGAPFNTFTMANVAATVGELITVCFVWDNADSRVVTSVLWGAAALTQRNAGMFRPLADFGVDIWTVLAPATALQNLVITWSGNITQSVALVHTWTHISSAVQDRLAVDGSPPQAIGAPSFSGFTPNTTQAHELVIGTMGYADGGALLNGLWILPLVFLDAAWTGLGHNLGIEVAYTVAHAIGPFEARRAGWSPPICFWGMLCTTFKSP